MIVDTVLIVAVALLVVLLTALLRSHAALARRVELLERALARRERVTARGSALPAPRSSEHALMDDEASEDVIDIEGLSPDGVPTTVPLGAADAPHLVAFLSSTCTTCVGFWERFRGDALGGHVPGVEVTVVPKDPAVEDVARVRELSSDGAVRVVMSSEAWDDYEVPASPYFVLVDGRPRAIVSEGPARTWDDLMRMLSRARLATSG